MRESVISTVKPLLDIVPVISAMEKELKDKPRALNAAVDAVHLVRSCKAILEGVEKSLNSLENTAAENICFGCAMSGEKNHGTANATATPNPDVYVKFPNKPGDEGYEEFVSQLPLRAVRPHYPTVTELINEELALGNQLPYGLKPADMKGVLWKVRLLSKKEI